MRLRPYQADLIDDVRDALTRHRSVLLQAPTGAGKTALTGFMLRTAAERGYPSVFTCHRREILDQAAETLRETGLEFGYIAAGKPYNPHHVTYLASIDTLRRRLDKVPAPALLIVDESHHASSKTWAAVLEAWRGARVVGLTATPERLDGRGLDHLFDTMVTGPSVRSLIDAGYLADFRIYGAPQIDMSAVHTRMGDYVVKDLENLYDTAKLVGDVVGQYQRLAAGKRAICFAVSIQHSQHLVERFQAAGIRAEHVDGETPTVQREAAMDNFRAGDIQVLSNVALFGEGVDVPGIEAVILARPTQSLALHLQQVGRGLRVAHGKSHAIILDHAGNTLRHGFPDDDREWSLAGRKQRLAANQRDGDVARQCPECFRVHKPAPACPHCGHIYKPVVAAPPEEVEADLQELERARIAKARRQEQGKADSLEALVALGKERGYKHPARWAQHVWNSRSNRRRSGVRASA